MPPEDPTLLDALSEAVESGAGLPAVARAAARLLDASIALIDRSSAVLAVAGASPDQEERLLAGGDAVTVVELRVADSAVGELRYRAKAPPAPSIARMVTTLLALELERSRSPEWASEEVASAFVADVLGRRVTERADIIARGASSAPTSIAAPASSSSAPRRAPRRRGSGAAASSPSRCAPCAHSRPAAWRPQRTASPPPKWR